MEKYIFHHNIPCYVTSEVSLRFNFALFDDGLTLTNLKLAYIVFAFKLFRITHRRPRKMSWCAAANHLGLSTKNS